MSERSNSDTIPGIRPSPTIFVQLALLIALASSAAYARATLSPLQEFVSNGLALSDNQMAIIQGPALAVPIAIGAIPIGMAVDRWVRTRLLAIGAILSASATILGAVAPDFVTLAISRMIVGIAAPIIGIAVVSMIADIVKVEWRGRAFLALSVGQVSAMSAAFATGGWYLTLFADDGQQAWRYALGFLAIPLIVLLLPLLLVHEPNRIGKRLSTPSARSTLMQLWGFRRQLVPLLAGGAMVGMADSAVLVWGAPSLIRTFDLSVSQVGTLMASTLLVAGLGGPALGGFAADISQKRGGAQSTIRVLALLAAASAPMGLFGIFPTAELAIAAMAVFLILGHAIGVIKATLLTVVLPNELRGLAMALATAVGTLTGLGVAPLLVSQLAGALGGRLMIGCSLAAVCCAISMIGAFVFLFAATGGGSADATGDLASFDKFRP